MEQACMTHKLTTQFQREDKGHLSMSATDLENMQASTCNKMDTSPSETDREVDTQPTASLQVEAQPVLTIATGSRWMIQTTA